MWKIHRFWYRVSGGRIGGKTAGLPVLRLTTTGRTSGKSRDVMLTYLDDPRGFIVVASNAGDQHDPAWWRNLQVDPAASIRIGRKTYVVRMRQLEGDEVALLDKGHVDEFTGRITWES